jgi:dnd system-associated protein 4
MRRIQRDTKHEEFIKTLTSGEQPIFKEIWRLLHFASAVGIAHRKRVPLKSIESGNNIRDNTFGTPGWPGYLYLIGITETGDSEILRTGSENEEAVVTAFEEYANGGLEVIQEKIKHSSSPLDALVLLALEMNSKGTFTTQTDALI